MSDCIFCQIIAGRIPATKVFDDDRVLAFMDINPLNPGHLLIIPRRHSPTIYDVEPTDLAAVFAAAQRLARAIKKALDPPGLNLVQSNNRVAGQIIDHFHLHLIPRWPNDSLSALMDWRLEPGDPAAIQDTARKIKEAL